jgi:hypothetical protein
LTTGASQPSGVKWLLLGNTVGVGVGAADVVLEVGDVAVEIGDVEVEDLEGRDEREVEVNDRVEFRRVDVERATDDDVVTNEAGGPPDGENSVCLIASAAGTCLN